MKLNKKLFYKIAGIIFMILGIIGIFLPLLPTTPFILLSATLFFNSSPKLFMFLINNRLVGLSLYTFLKYRSISIRTKLTSILLLWTVSTISVHFIDKTIVKIMIFLIITAVTIHILSYRNLTEEERIKARTEYHNKFKRKTKKKDI